MYDEGDISKVQKNNLYKAARHFRVSAADHLIKLCPFKEELLTHAT